MKYHMVVLGCQMNMSDSERIRQVFNSIGFQETQNEEDADILGVIACSVRQKAIDKVFTRIHKWNLKKNRSSLLTFLTGCVLDKDREKFLSLFDMVFATKDIAALPEMITQYGVTTPAALRNGLRHISENDEKQEDFWQLNPQYSSDFEAFIPIQNGCNKFCTYCAVPYTRGREESRPSQEIIIEFQNLMNKGYKSITLLGQNVNSYGLDKKGDELSFAELLDKLGEMADQKDDGPWIYFTSPHPKDMTDHVLEVMSKHKSIAKQIHLPLQSGDDQILHEMNRNHSLDDYRKIVVSIRKYMPGATICTDIIVGFPGETEEQFLGSLHAMEEFKFNMAFVACYSPRPGAKSSKLEDNVPQTEKKERLHRLSQALTHSATQWNNGLIGQELDLLITGKSRKGDQWSGRTQGLINMHIPMDNSLSAGDRIKVKVTGIAGLSLVGEKSD